MKQQYQGFCIPGGHLVNFSYLIRMLGLGRQAASFASSLKIKRKLCSEVRGRNGILFYGNHAIADRTMQQSVDRTRIAGFAAATSLKGV